MATSKQGAKNVEVNIHSYLVHLSHYALKDFTFKWFEDDGAISGHKFCLSISWKDYASADIGDGEDADDIPKLPGTCALDVGHELVLEILDHPWPEIRRMQQNRMSQFFL